MLPREVHLTRGIVLEHIRAVNGSNIKAHKIEKERILEEFVRTTGDHRKSTLEQGRQMSE